MIVRKKIMNKIIISNNRLDDYEDDLVLIENKKIYFKSNGDYTLEYVDSDKIELELIVCDNVCVKLFIYSNNQDLEVFNHYILGENSSLLLFQFYNNKNVFEEKIVDLNGKFSRFYQAFSSISCGVDEYHIIVNHNNKNVCSELFNKCIGLDGASIQIIIDSVLMKGNTDCKMDQNTRILTLGDVNAKVVPNMFCDDDSVEARHGSVIGSFSLDEVFYLMSRGITYDDAILLLIKGFIFSNLIVDMEKRALILSCIQNLRR